MCASDISALRPGKQAPRGFATPEALVGVLLALVAVIGALAAARGLLKVGAFAMAGAEQTLSATWALERMAHEIGRAGLGVRPGTESDCPDEALEYLDAGALAVRGDLDGDDPTAAFIPERWLTGRFPLVPTGNDEVVVYLLRPSGREATRSITFEADLDSDQRTSLPDGTPVARRDGIVELIDAGPAAGGERIRGGTLYRVTFAIDARYAGTSRFRVTEPLLDDVVLFRVEGRDDNDARSPACGGLDDADARACRAAVRRVVLDLGVADFTGRVRWAHREIPLGCARRRTP